MGHTYYLTYLRSSSYRYMYAFFKVLISINGTLDGFGTYNLGTTCLMHGCGQLFTTTWLQILSILRHHEHEFSL